MKRRARRPLPIRPVIRPVTPPPLRRGLGGGHGAELSRLLDQYAYELPERFIAQTPAAPRDEAKLFVYDRLTREICIDTFRHLGQYLPPKAVLVFNETKVIPARVMAKKDTGGKIELLILHWQAQPPKGAGQGRSVTVITDRKLTIGQTVQIGVARFTVTSQADAEFTLRMEFSPKRFLNLLEKYGTAPIPPYMKHSPLQGEALKREYQTIFAKYPGSAAAPTASLHFTKRLLVQLKRQGTAVEFITLHVGLGTFAPLRAENLKKGKLHVEAYELSKAAAARLNRYRKEGRPIIAVGTTVARTLESAARRGRLIPGQGTTEIFIRPGYRWKYVSSLITNFHIPRSSLMMLVASLIGRGKLLALYEFAKKKRFRFFSFGDGMLIR